jgi:hypothetical protein
MGRKGVTYLAVGVATASLGILGAAMSADSRETFSRAEVATMIGAVAAAQVLFDGVAALLACRAHGERTGRLTSGITR